MNSHYRPDNFYGGTWLRYMDCDDDMTSLSACYHGNLVYQNTPCNELLDVTCISKVGKL